MAEEASFVVACANCGQKNRVAADARGNAPRCGRCKRDLGIGSVAVINDAVFDRVVEGTSVPVVVDCWAPWCGPCRAVAPVVEELASELSSKVRFAKLNVDENPVVASRFTVSSIPTLLLFRGGNLAGRITGARPKGALLGELERAGIV